MITYLKLIPSLIIEEVVFQVFRFGSNEQIGQIEFRNSDKQYIFIGFTEYKGNVVELTYSDLYEIYHRVHSMNGFIEEK